MDTVLFIPLHNGNSAPMAFYDSILKQVEEILPAILPGQVFTLEELCGKKFWDSLSKGNRILAGQDRSSPPLWIYSDRAMGIPPVHTPLRGERKCDDQHHPHPETLRK